MGFAERAWGETPLKVRVGLHTGEAEERDGDYFGPPLNCAARPMSAGHGGQILLSIATQELVRDRLPERAARMMGASEALLEETGITIQLVEQDLPGPAGLRPKLTVSRHSPRWT
jgi:class 3 adenylate cyclase